MPDIFDRIASEQTTEGDIFNRIASEPQGDIFNKVAAEYQPKSITDPWYLKKISLPDFIDKDKWEQSVAEIEASGDRIKEALINPEAPYGAVEAGINLGTMMAGVPAVGFGHMVDLVTDGKYKVAEKVSEKMIYEPQTESGQVIRDILFAPFTVAGKVGEKRADTLFEELKDKYGATDVRTSLYPAVRKTIWDIVGLIATGKALHLPRKGVEARVGEVEPLDPTFAKDQAKQKMVEETLKDTGEAQKSHELTEAMETWWKENLTEAERKAEEKGFVDRESYQAQWERGLLKDEVGRKGEPLKTPEEIKPEATIPPEIETIRQPAEGEVFVPEEKPTTWKDIAPEKRVPEKGMPLLKPTEQARITRKSVWDILKSERGAIELDPKDLSKLVSVYRSKGKTGLGRDYARAAHFTKHKNVAEMYDQQYGKSKGIIEFKLRPDIKLWNVQTQGFFEREFGGHGKRAITKALEKGYAGIEKVNGEVIIFNEARAKGVAVVGPARTIENVVSDVNTALGERGSLFGKKTPEQVESINRLKDDVSKIRFEANRRGKTIEKYLLDKREDPRVAYSIHKYAEEMLLRESKPVDLPTPEEVLESKTDSATVGKMLEPTRGEFLRKEGLLPEKEVPKTNRDIIREMEAINPPSDTLKGKLRKTRDGFIEEVLPPEDTYRIQGGVTGVKIYRRMSLAKQEANAWLWKHATPFAKLTKDIKKGSISSDHIGKALDGRISPEQLTRKQRKIHDYLKERFDFLINFYARQKVEGEAKFAQIARSARKYVDYTDKMDAIRGGRTLKELSKTEKQYYNKLLNSQRKYMKDVKLEELSPGEQEALKLLSSKIKNYLPHLFDRNELLSYLKEDKLFYEDKLKLATKRKKVTRYKNALRQTDEAINRLEGGDMITYQQLPTGVENKFFKPRKGRPGYSFDAIGAYEAYLHQMSRKLFYDPAVQEVARLHKKLPSTAREYNTWYVRDFLGHNKHKLSDLSNFIVTAQWIRTMGFNPRSPIVNLTQRLNTVADFGLRDSARGEAFAFTPEGKKLLAETGIARDVPHALFEVVGPIPKELMAIKHYSGWLFEKAELGNRAHALCTGFLRAKDGRVTLREGWRYNIIEPDILELKDFKKAMKDPARRKTAKEKLKNLTYEECRQFGTDAAYKHHFPYGKVGMPKMLRTPTGRVAGQFTSFTIKQLMYMHHLARTEPLKLVKYLAIAEGGNYLLGEYLDIDLSNALGIGVNVTAVIKAIGAIPEGDFRRMAREWRIAWSGGTGILPQGFGPTVKSAMKISAAFYRHRGLRQFKKELTHIQYSRLKKAWKGLADKHGDLYPYYNADGHLMYYLTGRELLQTTFGPAPTKAREKWQKRQRKRLYKVDYRNIIEDITSAAAEGRAKEHDRLIKREGIVPTPEQYLNAILRRELTYEERELLKAIGKEDIYQIRKEGE